MTVTVMKIIIVGDDDDDDDDDDEDEDDCDDNGGPVSIRGRVLNQYFVLNKLTLK